jgi:hypothetical protein
MSEKTKVFNIIKNITAILFSVAILVTGIIVVNLEEFLDNLEETDTLKEM